NDHRLTIEEIEELHPGLIQAVAEHPGVSFVQVRSATRGGMAIGPRGICYLDDGRVEGEDPTAEFGPHVLDSLRREEAMVHAAAPGGRGRSRPARHGRRRGLTTRRTSRTEGTAPARASVAATRTGPRPTSPVARPASMSRRPIPMTDEPTPERTEPSEPSAPI